MEGRLVAQSCRPWRRVGVRQLPEDHNGPKRSSFVRDAGCLCPKRRACRLLLADLLRTGCTLLFTSVYGEIERKDTVMIGRPLEYFGMAQGADGVVITGAPMLLHAGTRELIVLRRALVVLGAIDQLHNIVGLPVGYILQ
jgi:hypothetical protein